MTVSAGLGIANFPFEDAKGFWRWVDLCDNGGVDSIWQSDRLIGPGRQQAPAAEDVMRFSKSNENKALKNWFHGVQP